MDAKDLKIDTYTTGTQVHIRITHLPTGKIAESSGQSYFMARKEAWLALEEKLKDINSE